MTWTLLQLDRRGSLNLPADLKRNYNITPAGVSIALLDMNGVILAVPLVGDAHQVYAAHGEAGLMQWVTQQTGLPINTTTPPYSPALPRKTAAEVKLEAQERRLRLSHELKMQHLAAQAQVIQLRRDTAKERAVALLEAKDLRNKERYILRDPGTVVTPDDQQKFIQEQAAMLSSNVLPQINPE